ncbi:hypothetical protein CYLTODRAFT_425639 [Cylindrobasidium torrendii FP15055 ss-10]|uniref:Uncharacterized protein n=1 Tax=Cylindrobasidium torrendii FP15055 ss-10 TaxID=1314674 RepID=A0A0D7B040_9AGAR|nr:hypothetical protein CYLTODRAFT_425639 [Cylindrobasidium torrendii FP15055 ss-10]
MDEPYPEDCISLSREFVQPQSRALFKYLDIQVLRAYSTSAGLVLGEIEQLLKAPFGTMSLQPSMWTAVDSGSFAFMPPDHVQHLLVAAYEYNSKRDYHQRRRLDEFPPPTSLKYTAHARSLRRGVPIFTKNPRTGVVTTHLSPYTDLPTFSVTSAHPSLMTVKAILYVNVAHAQTMHPLIERLFYLSSHIDPVFAPPPWQPNPCSTPSPIPEASSDKRKAVDDDAQPNKRQKVAAPALRSPVTRAKRTRRPITRVAAPTTLKIPCPQPIPARTYYRRGAKDTAMVAMTPKSRRRAGP